MWIPSHSSQARNPLWRPNGPSQPMFVTPARRPMTATSPRSLNRNGGTASPRRRRSTALARVAPALDPALGDARDGPVGLPRLHGRVADHEDLRVVGDRQPGPDADPAVAVGLGARRLRDPPAERRREHAGGPEHRPRLDRLGGARVLHAHAAIVDVDDACRRPDRHPEIAGAGGPPTPSGPAGRSAGCGPSPPRGRSGRRSVGSSGSRCAACRSRSRPAHPRARRPSARHRRARTSSRPGGSPGPPRARRPRRRSGSVAASRSRRRWS